MSKKAAPIFRHIILFIFTLLFFLPFLWTFLSSFKTGGEIFQLPFSWLPEEWKFDNYVAPFRDHRLLLYFLNSLGVAIVVTLCNLLFDSMVGWALAQFRFPGRTIFFFFILGTLMLPLQVIIIPLFLIVKSFGWLNSYLALTVPGIMSAFGIFLMRQWFLNFPKDTLEAARLDGASELRIFFRIVLPTAGPALGALAIFIFMANWDSFLWPLVVVSREEYMTVPLGISTFVGEYQTAYNHLMAVSVIGMIPMLIVFLIFQKQFVQGIASTGSKG